MATANFDTRAALLRGLALAIALSGVVVVTTSAQEEGTDPAGPGDAAVEANNPLADIRAFNVQNYYVPDLSGLPDSKANTLWLRYAQPFGKWLFRGSLPVNRVPTPGGNTSGLGDFNAFLAYLFDTGNPGLAVGAGPLLAAPTATSDETGSGKWQGGLATVLFNGTNPRFQWGGLLTYQTDFAGDDERADTSLLVAQPFYFWQLGKGLYVRGAPLWVFNLETDSYHVPIGLGVGQVVPMGRTVFNFFIEPQFTVLDRGIGQPEFQLFMAVNMQFLSKKK